MSSLAVFDFDQTIVDDDSDATVIRKLKETHPPPEWQQSNYDWTPYMSDVFELAHSSGLDEAAILSCVSRMRPTEGAAELLTALAEAGWHVLVLTDANSVFVGHWLSEHRLQDKVTDVVTNPAHFAGGRLHIEPCMRQSSCPACPRNLCKWQALKQWVGGATYRRLVYVGDGRNDFCPAAHLPATATVFPRRGYPLEELLSKAQATNNPPVQAKVVPWDDHYRIIKELLPEHV